MQRLVALKVSAAPRGRGPDARPARPPAHRPRVRPAGPARTAEVLLVYMPYLPGGTLRDVLDHVRTVPADERLGPDAARGGRRRAGPPRRDRPGDVAGPGRCGRAGAGRRRCARLGAKLASALDYAHRHGRAAPGREAGQRAPDGRGRAAAGRLQRRLLLEARRGRAGGVLRRHACAYMAPEHLEAFDPDHPRPPESLDGRADVFGLAVTLWELLTGDRPFGTEPVRGELAGDAGGPRARRGGPAGPGGASRRSRTATYPGCEDVLLRCLDPDPDRRPATAGRDGPRAGAVPAAGDAGPGAAGPERVAGDGPPVPAAGRSSRRAR